MRKRIPLLCLAVLALFLSFAASAAADCVWIDFVDQDPQLVCSAAPAYACGDINGDGVVGVGDFFYLANFLYMGGPPPIGNADVNGDGHVDSLDAAYLVDFLFQGGPAPVC